METLLYTLQVLAKQKSHQNDQNQAPEFQKVRIFIWYLKGM